MSSDASDAPSRDGEDIHPAYERFRELGTRIRTHMGGEAKIAKIHQAHRRTIREHIELLVDRGSFLEAGTFVAEPREGQDFWALPGDGIIGGLATIGGRPVTVCGNDDTVRRGTNGPRGSRKLDRLYEMARRRGTPFIILGQSSGGRLPENLQPHHFAESSNHSLFSWLLTRRRDLPLVTVVIGDSFGSSSFYAALSDFVVQLDGTCLALTSPRVVEAATGENVEMERLGGTSIQSTVTGQIDARAATPDDAYELVRSFLSFLPSHAGAPLPHNDVADLDDDPEIAHLVPSRRTRAYDIRKVIARLVDDRSYLELKESFSPNIVTALGRIGGMPIGIVANQPMRSAGALTPDACEKATRLICLCDSFGLPVVFLVDNPGFLVGTTAEHGRALAKSMYFLRAGALARVPKVAVFLRKAFGLGFTVMGGGGQVSADLAVAWPGAEIGFMDPKVAVNVLFAGQAAELPKEEQAEFFSDHVDRMATDFAPFGVASSMVIDEIIEPAKTRQVVASFLQQAAPTSSDESALASWPFW